MTVSRIYLPQPMQPGDRCELTGENRQYVLSVLRMKKGDRLLLFDGSGYEYTAVILGHDHERIDLEITGQEVIHGERSQIILAQSLPKAKKMDFIIEKASELGANTIIPFFSERSILRLGPERSKLKQVRWQKIALEAARKSHSAGIPEVREILTLEKMLRSAGQEALKIIFWEEETGTNLREFLQREKGLTERDIFLVVGPEGGFTRQEIALAEDRGFTSVTLGRQILKVETAALAILAIIQYARGVFGGALEGGENS